MSDQVKGKTKPELERLIEANGGRYYQTYDAAPDMVCIGDKSKSLNTNLQSCQAERSQETVQVASRIKHGDADVIRPSWLFDCINQANTDVGRSRFQLPLEPRYVDVWEPSLEADTSHTQSHDLHPGQL